MRKTRKSTFLLLAALMLMISACSNSSGGSGGGSGSDGAQSGNQNGTDNSGTTNPPKNKDTFTITISDKIEHGIVTADKETAKKNEKVELTITPENEYELSSICIISSDESKKYLTGRGNSIIVNMPEDDITIAATFDLPPNTLLTTLPAGTDGTAGEEWTYVLLGDYPQTVKAKDITVNDERYIIRGKYKYMQGSDDAWYYKCKQEHSIFDRTYTYSDGTEVTKDDKDKEQYFKVEPIKWRVLTDDYNDKKLLLAEKALFWSLFDNWSSNTRIINNTTVYPNNYEYSYVRERLNDEFLNTAFSKKAQKQICDTLVINDVESTLPTNYSTLVEPDNISYVLPKDGKNDYVCSDTTDKIFLLSMKEVTTVDYGFDTKLNVDFEEESTKAHSSTDYFLATIGFDNNYAEDWFLRSPYSGTLSWGNSKYGICSVSKKNISVFSVHVKVGVVPALCVE